MTPAVLQSDAWTGLISACNGPSFPCILRYPPKPVCLQWPPPYGFRYRSWWHWPRWCSPSGYRFRCLLFEYTYLFLASDHSNGQFSSLQLSRSNGRKKQMWGLPADCSPRLTYWRPRCLLCVLRRQCCTALKCPLFSGKLASFSIGADKECRSSCSLASPDCRCSTASRPLGLGSPTGPHISRRSIPHNLRGKSWIMLFSRGDCSRPSLALLFPYILQFEENDAAWSSGSSGWDCGQPSFFRSAVVSWD